MFSAEDYAHIIQFMSRVQLQGQEAPVFVGLIHKLQVAGQAAAKVETDPPQGKPAPAEAVGSKDAPADS